MRGLIRKRKCPKVKVEGSRVVGPTLKKKKKKTDFLSRRVRRQKRENSNSAGGEGAVKETRGSGFG